MPAFCLIARRSTASSLQGAQKARARSPAPVIAETRDLVGYWRA